MIKSELVYYLNAINKYHSITTAAEALYISQPALSMAIKRFEEELNFPLLIREKKEIRLTDDALEILLLTEPALASLAAAENYILLRKMNLQTLDNFTIYFTEGLSYLFLQDLLPSIQQFFRDRTSVDYRIVDNPYDFIESNKTDTPHFSIVAFCGNEGEQYNELPNFTFLFKSSLYLRCKKNSKFLQKVKTNSDGSISMQDCNFPFIYIPGYFYDLFLEGVKKKTALNIIYADNYSLLNSYVKADRGVCIAYSFSIADEILKEKYECFKISDFPEINFYAFSSENFNVALFQYIKTLLIEKIEFCNVNNTKDY